MRKCDSVRCLFSFISIMAIRWKFGFECVLSIRYTNNMLMYTYPGYSNSLSGYLVNGAAGGSQSIIMLHLTKIYKIYHVLIMNLHHYCEVRTEPPTLMDPKVVVGVGTQLALLCIYYTDDFVVFNRSKVGWLKTVKGLLVSLY